MVEMTEANSRGMRLSLEAVTPGNRIMRWASCDPGTGTLSPSTGLWYPRGETMRCLAVAWCGDLIHMYVGCGFKLSCVYLCMLCTF